jgi:hypothetical protein
MRALLITDLHPHWQHNTEQVILLTGDVGLSNKVMAAQV